MNNLIQTIQEQIDLVMNSKMAKYSDKKLETFEKQSIVTPEILKIASELYSNGLTMREIATELKVSRAFVQVILKMRNDVAQQNKCGGMKKRKIHEEKTNDILNGMGVHEFCEKWNCPYNGYYDKKWRIKKKLQKDLAESK